MLGESILKEEIQQLLGMTVISRGIVLQLRLGVSQHAGAQMIPFACFFQVLALCFYEQHSAEAQAAEVGWGADRCVMLGAGSVNQVLSNTTSLLLKMSFLNPVELGLFSSAVWVFYFLFYSVLLQYGFTVQSFV